VIKMDSHGVAWAAVIFIACDGLRGTLSAFLNMQIIPGINYALASGTVTLFTIVLLHKILFSTDLKQVTVKKKK